MKSLFVGNLNFQTTEADLTALFQPFGQVGRIHIATDRETGRARGFAFVEMPNDAEAAKAIAALAGKEMGGRNHKVNEARRILARGLPRIGSQAARTALVTLLLSMVLACPGTFEEAYEHHVQKAPKGNEESGKATC